MRCNDELRQAGTRRTCPTGIGDGTYRVVWAISYPAGLSVVRVSSVSVCRPSVHQHRRVPSAPGRSLAADWTGDRTHRTSCAVPTRQSAELPPSRSRQHTQPNQALPLPRLAYRPPTLSVATRPSVHNSDCRIRICLRLGAIGLSLTAGPRHATPRIPHAEIGPMKPKSPRCFRRPSNT